MLSGTTPRRRKEDVSETPTGITPVESLRDWLAHNPKTPQSVATTGLFVLALLYTMYFARDFLLPIAFALYVKTVLTPLVRRLRKWNVPDAVGAGLVLLATLFSVAWAGYRVLGPANEWLERAPDIVERAQNQIGEWSVLFENVGGQAGFAIDAFGPSGVVEAEVATLLLGRVTHQGRVDGAVQRHGAAQYVLPGRLPPGGNEEGLRGTLHQGVGEGRRCF